MHVALGEGDGDALGVEALLDRLVEVEPQGPVVTGGGPAAQVEVDRAVGQLLDQDLGRGLGVDPAVRGHELQERGLCLVDVVAVRDADHHVQAPRLNSRVIEDRAVPDLGVGHLEINAVVGAHVGGEQADLVDGARQALGVDVVAGPEGAQEQQHDAGGDVLQRALERQADRQAAGGEQRDDAGGLDPELGQDRDQHEHQDAISHDAADHRLERIVDPRHPVQHPQHAALRPAGHRPADDQDRQRAEHFEPVVDHQVDRLVQETQDLLRLLFHGPSPRHALPAHSLTDVSQITPKFREIVPRSTAKRTASLPRPSDGLILEIGPRLEGHLPDFRPFRHTPPVEFTWPSMSPAYAGTGHDRNSSIRRRISQNRFRGTATSANWKVTYWPWRATLAPILTSFLRSVLCDC